MVSGFDVSSQAGDFETYTERVEALRALHPELDVGRVLWRQPGVLKVKPRPPAFRVAVSASEAN